jgi:glycosyltransferase involved in cell wall biosynthesis
MSIHQLIPTFHLGDATGQAAIHLRLLLRRLGHDGEIYADEVAPALQSLVRPRSALRPREDDLVLYHHGIASRLPFFLSRLRCRKGLVFHNISPERFYRGTPLRDALLTGRAQLAALAAHVELAIGVSRFNSAELEAAGFRNVHTVPLFVEAERFAMSQADSRMRARLAGPGPAVLSVSRVVPHKRFEDLIALHRELLRLRSTAQLWIVGGYEPGGEYYLQLKRIAQGLPGVHFLGRLTHAELVAAYRSASVFVSMSEHEGFGVPLIEAMAAELPVLAFGAAAVPETMGGAGIVFDEKRFAFLAELVREVSESGALRAQILRGQARRLEELSPDQAQSALAHAVHAERRTGGPESKHRKVRGSPRNSKPRVAVVVQRYGDVTGGAEKHAEQIVEHLAPHWGITVLTSCAKDHLRWDNTFPDGESRHGRAHVLRFPSERQRDMRRFNALSREIFGQALERAREEHWIAEQGPLLPGLMRHLSEEHGRYDGFVFFTYLYAPTVWGLPLVADRALLVPTAHDEPPFAFHSYADAFERPRALLCNTEEELALIDRRFPRHAPAQVVGVGVDVPRGDPARFRTRHGIAGPYLYYVGRLEDGKGIGELLRIHQALVRRDPDTPDLVLAGSGPMRISGRKVHALGRVTEEDKHDALAGAHAVVVPSRFESLSLLALEAFAHGTPVLANGDSEVLAGQIRRSGAGATYRGSEDFRAALAEISSERAHLSAQARTFAKRHTWERVVDSYLEQMERIRRSARR